MTSLLSETVVRVESLTLRVQTSDRIVRAVEGVSFDLHQGEVLGLVGESGSGKTMIGNALLGLIRPPVICESGTVTVLGEDVLSLDAASLRRLRGSGIAMVFQDPTSALNPVITIGRQVSHVIAAQQQRPRGGVRNAGLSLFERVGIPDPARRWEQYPYELSGGLRQRILIAMAIAGNPRVLIADEPTTALDATIQAQILTLLREIQSETRMAVVFISHDLDVIAELCDSVAVLYAGRIVERAPIRDIFNRPAHPYTAALLDARPDMVTPDGVFRGIPGRPPGYGALERGCSFVERCTVSQDQKRCLTNTPVSSPVQGEQQVACHYPLLESVSASSDASGQPTEQGHR